MTLEFTTFADGCGHLLVTHDFTNCSASIKFHSELTPDGVSQLELDLKDVAGIGDDGWVYYGFSNLVGVVIDPECGIDQREIIGSLVNAIKRWGNIGFVAHESLASSVGVIDPHREWYDTHDRGMSPSFSEA